jgi:hypothetical protein
MLSFSKKAHGPSQRGKEIVASKYNIKDDSIYSLDLTAFFFFLKKKRSCTKNC